MFERPGTPRTARAEERADEDDDENEAPGGSDHELTGTATRPSLQEREGQTQPVPQSSSFDDWITMVIKVPTAIEPGAVCKIFSPDGRAHFVTVPTSLPPGGSFIKALPKAYTEEVLKTLDRSEMKQWLRHRLEVAGQAEQQCYDGANPNPSRQELLRSCVQWLRDAKAKVLQEAATAAADEEATGVSSCDAAAALTSASEPEDKFVEWQPAWSGTYERQYWWHPITRATAWEKPIDEINNFPAAEKTEAQAVIDETEEPMLAKETTGSGCDDAAVGGARGSGGAGAVKPQESGESRQADEAAAIETAERLRRDAL